MTCCSVCGPALDLHCLSCPALCLHCGLSDDIQETYTVYKHLLGCILLSLQLPPLHKMGLTGLHSHAVA